MIYKNNIFDSVSIKRLDTSIVQIEDFANFGTVNAGTLSTQGTITDVPVGTCGF